jgi:hypothetical protein
MDTPAVVLVAKRGRPAVEGVFESVVTSLREHGADVRREQRLARLPSTDEVVIAHQPLGPRPGLDGRRVLGQRVLDRAERLLVVDNLGLPVPGWARAEDDAAVARLEGRASAGLLHKADRSYKGMHVRLLVPGERPADVRPGDVVMAVLDDDPTTYKAHVFGGAMISSHAYRSPPADRLPFPGGNFEYELFEPDDRMREVVTAIGRALLDFGAGYCAVDLMRAHGSWWVIEVNTGAVGLSSTWGGWPDRYAPAYAAALTAWLADGAPAPTLGEAQQRARVLGPP